MRAEPQPQRLSGGGRVRSARGGAHPITVWVAEARTACARHTMRGTRHNQKRAQHTCCAGPNIQHTTAGTPYTAEARTQYHIRDTIHATPSKARGHAHRHRAGPRKRAGGRKTVEIDCLKKSSGRTMTV